MSLIVAAPFLMIWGVYGFVLHILLSSSVSVNKNEKEKLYLLLTECNKPLVRATLHAVRMTLK